MFEFDSDRRKFLKQPTELLLPSKKIGETAIVVGALGRFVDDATRELYTRRRLYQGIGGILTAGFVGWRLLQSIWGSEDSPEEPVGTQNVIRYDQTSKEFTADEAFGSGESACGPTTIAMLRSTFEKTNISPNRVDLSFQREINSIRNGPEGDTMFRSGEIKKDVIDWLRERHYQVKKVYDAYVPDKNGPKSFDFEAAKKLIDSGNLIVASGEVKWIEKYQKAYPNGVNHIFLVTDVDVDKKTITIADPWGGKVHVRSIDKSDFNQFFYAYAIKPDKLLQEKINTRDKEPELKRMFSEGSLARSEIIKMASGFMDKEPSSQQREQAELRMFEELKQRRHTGEKYPAAADLVLALQGCASIEARTVAMSMIWEKRQAGELIKFGVKPLDQDMVEWARENEIDPNMLAISQDAFKIAGKLLKSAPEIFYEAMSPDQRNTINPTNNLVSPGLMAKLMMTETGLDGMGYVNIGRVPAIAHINTDPLFFFPSAADDLEAITKMWESATGLPFNKHKHMLPGSEWPESYKIAAAKIQDPEKRRQMMGSGGAIGPQITPINARIFMDWYMKANEKTGNILPSPVLTDPWMGTINAFLFLGSKYYHRQGSTRRVTETVRPSYELSSGEAEKMTVMGRWNGDSSQLRSALQSGYSYFRHFARSLN